MDLSRELAANFHSNCKMIPPPPLEGATTEDQEVVCQPPPVDGATCHLGDQDTRGHCDDLKGETRLGAVECSTSPSYQGTCYQGIVDTQEYLERLDDEDDIADGLMTVPLLTLPPELIWCIVAFLDAKFVVTQLSLVCKQLYSLVNDDVTWKVRISKRFPKRYPIITVNDSEFDWKHACMQREEQYHLWSDAENTMESYCLSMGHYAAVDSVHLMKNGSVCISGSRDRTMQIWDLKQLDASKPKESVEAARLKSIDGHKGWIWHITSRDDTMVTSSWDCWLKLWDMNRECTEVRKFRSKSALLCTVYLPDVLVSGSFDKIIYIHDHRANDPLVDKLRHHKRAVLTMEADDQYIVSGSEDKTIAVFDRRAGKLLKEIKLDSFPMCLSYGHNQLWSGQKDGTLHVLDPTYGNFDIVETYKSGHQGKVTDVIYNLGSVITCSTDKTIKVHEPNHNPAVLMTQSGISGELAALCLQNNVLASACSDATVILWKPSTSL